MKITLVDITYILGYYALSGRPYLLSHKAKYLSKTLGRCVRSLHINDQKMQSWSVPKHAIAINYVTGLVICTLNNI